MANIIYQKVSIAHDYGELPVRVGAATEDSHVMNKGQVDTAISGAQSESNSYTDTKDSATRNYVDAKILGLGEFVSAIDPANGLPTTGSGEDSAIDKNDYWTFSEDGTILGVEVHKYEKLIANVSGASVNDDFRIEHSPHTDDTRFSFENVIVPATTQEIKGKSNLQVQTPLETGDVWVIGAITITAGGNLDVTANTTNIQQVAAIRQILIADNAFNTQYTVTDNLDGTFVIEEKSDQASGINLSHNESGVVGGNAVFNTETNSVAYDLGDYIVNHNLGYKYVQVIAADSSTDMKLETPPIFVDENSLKLINGSNADITVSGVVSI